MIVIEAAQVGDLSAVSRLNESIQNLHQKLDPNRYKDFAEECVILYLRDIYQKPDYEVIVARDKKTIVGYAICRERLRPDSPFQREERFLELEQISVDPPHRSQGVGKKLWDYVVGIAKKRNCGSIQLSVLSSNQVALDFYDRIGLESMNLRMIKVLD